MTQAPLIDVGPTAAPAPAGSDEWFTAPDTGEWARAVAGVSGWDLDVAACDESHLAARYYTKADDGLRLAWRAPRVWCNPPFSQIGAWVEKAWRELHASSYEVCAMLLPASRTEQAWWQDWVEPYRDAPDSPLRTCFQRGRAAFAAPGTNGEPIKGSPFGCVLLVFRRVNT